LAWVHDGVFHKVRMKGRDSGFHAQVPTMDESIYAIYEDPG
jgi:hypothetical protein